MILNIQKRRQGVGNDMNALEQSAYIQFVREFENRVERKLTMDEKEFLKWLAKKHVS